MALRPRTLGGSSTSGTPSALLPLGTVNTSPANNLLAASATLTRYLRSIKVKNNTAGTLTWNFGVGAAAVLTGTNAEYFSENILAAGEYIHYWGGRGRRVDNLVIMAFASGAGVNLTLNYDESDALDA
jgi:hypothetical protein